MAREEEKDGKRAQKSQEQLEGGKQSACSLKNDTTSKVGKNKQKKKTQFIGLLLLMGDNILC